MIIEFDMQINEMEIVLMKIVPMTWLPKKLRAIK
jgi:hypothetical protein